MPVYSDPGVYILITDAAGHLRRFLPRKHFQAFTGGKTAENGFDTFQLDLSAEVTDLDNIAFRDQVELWFGCVLQYRGFVQEKHRALPTSENDPPTLTLAGNGVSFEAGLQDVDGDLQLPLNTDIAEAWRRAFERTVFPSLPGLVAQAIPVGVTLQKQEGTYKLFKDVAQSLVSGVADGMAVTGGDADADGNNRLFLRPYSDRQDWGIAVPGAGVTAAEARDNSRDVRNRIRLFGGATRWPNLLPNPTFARILFSGTDQSNKLANPSFEDASAWTNTGSAEFIAAGTGPDNAARVGKQYVLLKNTGQALSQTVSVTPLDSYVFGVFARRENAAATSTLQLTVNWGSRTDTVDIAPDGNAFAFWGGSVAAPAGATSATFAVTCDSGGGVNSGVVIDDALFVNVSGASADGWVLAPFGDAAIVVQNWLYDMDAYRGTHCLHLKATATDVNGHDVHLELGSGASVGQPAGERRVPVTTGETVRQDVPVRSPPGVTSNGKMFLEIHFYKADGSDTGTRTKVTVPAGAGWVDWTLLTAEATAPADAALCGTYLTLRQDTELLVGGMCLRDAAAPADEFVGDGPYTVLLDCADPALADTDHGGTLPVGQGITADAAASQTTYGVRCEPLSDQSITNRADGRALAAAYFNANALAYPQPSVTVVNDARPFFPGQGVTLTGEAGKALMAGATVGTDGRPFLPIAQVRLQIDADGNFLQTLDLQEAKLDAYRRIYKASHKAAQAGGSAQVYTAGGGNGVFGGQTAPLTVTDGVTPIPDVSTLKLTGGALSSPADGEADFAAAITVENDTLTFHGIQTLKLTGGTLTNPTPGEADFDVEPPTLTLAGPFASRPAPGVVGRLYLETDGPGVGRDTGTAWQTFGPVFALTRPDPSDFTTVSSATFGGGSLQAFDVRGSGVLFAATGGELGADLATLAVIALPLVGGVPTGNFTACLSPSLKPIAGASWGMVLRESASGKFQTFALKYDGAEHRYLFVCENWSDPATPAGAFITPASFTDATAFVRGPYLWMTVSCQLGGTTFFVSADPFEGVQVIPVDHYGFITPDQAGLFINPVDPLAGSVAAGAFRDHLMLYSWAQTG